MNLHNALNLTCVTAAWRMTFQDDCYWGVQRYDPAASLNERIRVKIVKILEFEAPLSSAVHISCCGQIGIVG